VEGRGEEFGEGRHPGIRRYEGSEVDVNRQGLRMSLRRAMRISTKLVRPVHTATASTSSTSLRVDYVNKWIIIIHLPWAVEKQPFTCAFIEHQESSFE
jgi:hypothetical protein